ncbi:hypothetical protein [Dictyobacter arantiisoli]|nr:hypothetical protein [Dictyobacter arantiisoli]
MKRSLLARLRSNGFNYLISGLILLLGVPLYQVLILGSTGFSSALDETGSGRYAAYLIWISTHSLLFVIYRVLLLGAFFLLLTFPFALQRIIVAQELLGLQERAETQASEDNAIDTTANPDTIETEDDTTDSDDMTEHPWRGKGFVVLAGWAGLLGLAIYLIGGALSTGYFVLVGGSTGSAIHNSVTVLAPIFTIITNAVGTGLLGLACLFFGAMIVRTGKIFWPDSWVFFGYTALFVGAILCISAVAVVSAAGIGQSTLTTIATWLLAIWIIWLGCMLIRLKPEP